MFIALDPNSNIHLFAAMFLGTETANTADHPVAPANLLACVEKRGELKDKKFSNLLTDDASVEETLKTLLTDAGKRSDYADAVVVALKWADSQPGDTLDDSGLINALGDSSKFATGGFDAYSQDEEKYPSSTQVFRDGLRAYAKYVLGKKLAEDGHEILRKNDELGTSLPEWSEFCKKVPSYSADDTYNLAAQAVRDDVSRETTGTNEEGAKALVAPPAGDADDNEPPPERPRDERRPSATAGPGFVLVIVGPPPVSYDVRRGLEAMSDRGLEHAAKMAEARERSSRRLAALLAFVRVCKKTSSNLRLLRGVLFFEKRGEKAVRRAALAGHLFTHVPQEMRDEADWTSADAIATDLTNKVGGLNLELDDRTALSRELERLIAILDADEAAAKAEAKAKKKAEKKAAKAKAEEAAADKPD